MVCDGKVGLILGFGWVKYGMFFFFFCGGKLSCVMIEDSCGWGSCF